MCRRRSRAARRRCRRGLSASAKDQCRRPTAQDHQQSASRCTDIACSFSSRHTPERGSGPPRLLPTPWTPLFGASKKSGFQAGPAYTPSPSRRSRTHGAASSAVSSIGHLTMSRRVREAAGWAPAARATNRWAAVGLLTTSFPRGGHLCSDYPSTCRATRWTSPD
jgi:hypothetical protein